MNFRYSTNGVEERVLNVHKQNIEWPVSTESSNEAHRSMHLNFAMTDCVVNS